jgi:chromosomal replication initiator protein
MEHTANDVWSRILEEARTVLPEQAYQTWLAPTEAIAVSQDLLVVSTPNPFAVDWVEDKYGTLLTSLGERLFGRRFTISVQFHSDGTTGPRPPAAEGAPPAAEVEQGAAPASAPMPEPAANGPSSSSPLNERYTFDRFVVGSNSQMAAAAAHAVAQAPARMYNPLFIYGGVGLGKTHLMHAVGHATLAREPGKRVVYISSEQFTNELVTAIQEGNMPDFRRRYRGIDLLLVDDIQFLEGKERTQEEFFHTFNALHDAQKQIVLTSDRPPKEIGVEDRLISRFEWGLVTDIKPPDFETRVAILRKRVEEDDLDISGEEEVLTYVAERCSSSVRELEGAVIKLLAFSSLHRREITPGMAHEVLGQMDAADGLAASRPTAQRVRDRVAEAWGVTPDALQSKKRTKELTVPRQVAMYLIKEMFDLSLVDIGKLFGGRDHSTVIHSVDRVAEMLEEDAALRERVDALREELA